MQVTWSGTPISWDFPKFVVIHIVKGFSVVNEAEVDAFLEISSFFYDTVDVGNLISGFSTFSKSILHIWKFTVHILVKPDLENFEHYFSRVWDESSFVVVWTFFGIALLLEWKGIPLGLEWKLIFFQSCDHCWVFQICWDTECSTLTASSFRILNSFKISLNFDTAYGSTFAYWIYVNVSATDLWGRFISFSGLWKSYHPSQDHPLFLAALGSCELAVFYRECWSIYFKVSHGRGSA